jgi:hypothetical protein
LFKVEEHGLKNNQLYISEDGCSQKLYFLVGKTGNTEDSNEQDHFRW